MLKGILSAAIAASLLSIPAVADISSEETVRTWQVDTSGRPPFKRTLVEMPVVEAASMETVEVASTERVWTTQYNGRPPFKRSYEDLPVVDAASMETGSASEESQVSPKPFFKSRHR